MTVNLRSLIGKLNGATRSALEAAAGMCLSRTHYDVEIEHFLMKLLGATDNDFALILKTYGVDRSHLTAELTHSLDRLKTGNARNPALSPTLLAMLTDAWTIGSIDFGASHVRTGHTVLALVSNPELARLVRDVSREFSRISSEALRKDFFAIVSGSAEDSESAAEMEEGGPRAAGGKTPHLDQYTVDLTERARQGKIDPVLGRDVEIRQMIDVLTRRRQNNPILVGEAGVGKTAVVEGFALRVAHGDVPVALKNVAVRTLDLALLQAGAGVKGEFENRLKGLIDEVKSSSTPIILFIDEAHTMIGAGGQAGQNDAANILKPALARGELRTMAATTWAEYKQYFEKDDALKRRFQPVKVEEPTEEQCLVMLRGITPALERHHKVRILDGALDAATRLSHRFIADRQLPDKAVSVLDTACARIALGQSATPPAVEDARRRLDDLAVQARVLEREAALGADHSERLGEIGQRRVETETRLAALSTRWEEERGLVDRIRTLRERIESAHVGTAAGARPGGGPGATAGDGAAREGATREAGDAKPLRAELADLTARLEALQGEAPLVRVCVEPTVIGEVISGWTGVPIGRMLRDEMQTTLDLEQHLGRRIIGQDHALEVISRRIRTSKAGIEDPSKPKGVFMLVGPSGVGKTETAITVADLLYGGEQNMVTINMSEYKNAEMAMTALRGASAGYVGYGKGGILTEAVRRRPYSVVLLDEAEKAQPEVLELFFQVFDKGVMEDAEGRRIDFSNTMIFLTTNAGTDSIMKLTADPETMPSMEGLARALKPELDKIFKPAFLGRLVVVPYFPIRDENMKRIILLKLGKIQRRVQETHRVALTYDDALVTQVAFRCTEVESGARNVDNILTNTLLPELSRLLLVRMAEGTRIGSINVTVNGGGAFAYETRDHSSAAKPALSTAGIT